MVPLCKNLMNLHIYFTPIRIVIIHRIIPTIQIPVPTDGDSGGSGYGIRGDEPAGVGLIPTGAEIMQLDGSVDFFVGEGQTVLGFVGRLLNILAEWSRFIERPCVSDGRRPDHTAGHRHSQTENQDNQKNCYDPAKSLHSSIVAGIEPDRKGFENMVVPEEKDASFSRREIPPPAEFAGLAGIQPGKGQYLRHIRSSKSWSLLALELSDGPDCIILKTKYHTLRIFSRMLTGRT